MPAAPEGEPTGFAVVFSADESTEFGDFVSELPQGDGLRVHLQHSRQRLHAFPREMFDRRRLGGEACIVLQLQQSHGQHAQHANEWF